MGTQITTYKEQEIVYDEDRSVFLVPNTGWEAATLKALKSLIDKAATEERRVSKPALMMVSSYMKPDYLEEVTITSLVAMRRYEDEVKEAWIKRASGDRQKQYLYNLYPPTEEVRAAFAAYLEARAAQKAATEATARAKASIPTCTAASLRPPAAAQADTGS